MTQRQGQVIDEYQRPVPGATVYVYNEDGTDAALTYDGSTPLAQPVVSDEYGVYTYNVPDAFYREDTWYGGKLRFREILAVGNPPEAKGDPGGNVMAIGTFTQASSLTVPAGTKLVQVTGTSTAGDTGSGRQFIEAAEVTTGFVTANPLIAFRDAAGRGFREIDVKTGGKITPYLLVITGQSNAAGAAAGGPNPASPGVQTWNGQTSAWGGSDYTQAPWSITEPHGNGGFNNFALAAAHRIYAETRRPVYIIFHATGGTAIDAWVGSGTSSTFYAAVKAKIEAALATSQLSTHSKAKVDAIIWAQGEADFTHSYATHHANLATLESQWRAEAWMDTFTPVFVTGMSDTHDRYEVAYALRHFCAKVGQSWNYISTKGIPTIDGTHFTGPGLWEIGYNRIAAQVVNPIRPTPEAEPSLFYGLGSGVFTPGDNIPAAVTSLTSLASWESRTDGPGVNDTFTGDGATTVFALTSRGTVPSNGVTIAGTVVPATNYTVDDVDANPRNITFTAPPANAAAVIVGYNAAVNGPAALGSLSWGWRCYANGNYTFAGGKQTATSNACNYTIVYGNNIFANDSADYSAGFGRDISLQNTYQGAFGRGHTLLGSGGFACGTYSGYTDGSRRFQVGIGTADGSRRNAIGVNAGSGNVEIYAPSGAADPGNTSELTFALTSNTTLVVKAKGTDGTVRSATLTLA